MPDPNPAEARSRSHTATHAPVLEACRSPGRSDGCRKIVVAWLGQLDARLHHQPADTDRRSVRHSLRELAALIDADRLGLSRLDYEELLARLAAIFTNGASAASEGLLAAMAPSYAGVVVAISRACPTCDYEVSLGQLLRFMAKLFLDRRSGWKSVYRSIRAILHGTAAKQRLDEVEFARLEEWVESGAANLFSLQRDLGGAIGRLRQQAADLEGEVTRRTTVLEQSVRERRDATAVPNVIFLDAWCERREIAELRRRHRGVIDELEAKRAIKDLVDSDIRGLEDCLLAIRRAYDLRLVWAAT